MKYKIFIICTLTGLFLPLLTLVSCNSEPEKTEEVKLNANTFTPNPGLRKPDNPPPNPDNPGGGAAGNSSRAANQQDEAEKQVIVDKLKASIIVLGIKSNIDIHDSTTWDEDKQGYALKASYQLFGVIQYTNAQKQQKLYNLQDDESKTARREMYLGLDYNSKFIKPFGALANKMIAAKNVQMKTDLENMVDKIRKYAKAYYLTAYNTLIKKQDKLMELGLSALQTLKAKFDEINLADTKIFYGFTDSIYNDYKNDIEIGTAFPKKNQLQSTATPEEIQNYLNGKFTSVTSDLNKGIDTATDIADILNKIQ
ncbi:virulence associated lipoprotein [Borrelia hermsii]|uniref:virulence associated lipoprotein n=1 Tax=Borrelia hermsii TaxID=140 RepID=UPI00046D4A85|nr:virulence associated lipoprotein [Borrelia hermsii]